eukprot:CAMPEP_0197187096 /NCGR_PEP_ID=MMETSP1423-20130617/15229_1 /TAXON_ID=476441 /ORGANISM="Pseudo-nitzschia heimii, Strain UNC1101" /LENGTH=1037 /DNA_ID=CAMNT_0042638585 /DNA_START=43 /DNA_END=3156 /DNA_ORIENTATION=+
MKIPSSVVTSLFLLSSHSGVLASSSSSAASSAGAHLSSTPSTRKSKFLPWTKAKVYNPVGGDSVAVEESESKDDSESLEVSIPLSQSSTLSANDAPLTRDIEMLTEILSDLVLHEDENLHKLCEEFIGYGSQRAKDPNDNAPLDVMIDRAKTLTASECLGMNRYICTALSLVNSAEVQHRLRNIREHERKNKRRIPGPLYHMEDSIKGTIQKLIEDEGANKDEIFDQLCEQKVEFVLTAHPTEVNRKSVLRKYRKVTELLAYLERSDLLPHEQLSGTIDLQRIISSVWGMDEIRRNKPTVQKEAAGGLAIVDTVLWKAVPNYLRKLDKQCLASLGKRLPLEVCPIKFASWIGGDRDGNPNCTPQVTREVVLHQRLRAARLYLKDLSALESQLAISSKFSPEMIDLAGKITSNFHQRELYRRVISHLRKRLVKTANEVEMKLENEYLQNDPGQAYHLRSNQEAISASLKTLVGDETDEDALEIVKKAEDLLAPLRIMHESLVETGFDLMADGLLSDIIRRLKVFGITLVPLDIREESTKHTNALDAITRWLGIGSYAEWDEEARVNWLSSELSNRRPLFPSERLQSMNFDAGVTKTLQVFQTASELEPEALGAYVISQCQTASDVLAVMLLQKQFGMTAPNGNMMRVAPLFETLDDLNNAPERLKTLFSVPAYVGAINGKQEVMVGYSDSAKDAGRLAACWAQYLSQERMVEVADAAGIEICFFHGKGGTVGRGGNPALYRAVLSHPPNTINGRFRVTEQGEMITQNYGSEPIAEHTLDIYTAAVLREQFTKRVEPTEDWRRQMERISDVSCKDYRHLVREEPRFVPYFRQATPELELQSLNIGSRPSKRNPKGGIESLRAIPWTFAWTQTRTHLSAWLGVGAGLTASDADDLECLQEMYTSWPWFRELIDLIAMIVSKTDFSVSKNYDDQLVVSEESKRLGVEVREKLVQTRQSILDVTRSETVAGHHVALQRASNSIRAPYVDPLNVIQAELLKRFRALDERDDDLGEEERAEKETLQDALIVSINGISSGMRNSG